METAPRLDGRADDDELRAALRGDACDFLAEAFAMRKIVRRVRIAVEAARHQGAAALDALLVRRRLRRGR